MNVFKKTDHADVKKLFLNEDVRKYLGGIRDEVSISGALNSMLNPPDNAFYWVVREKQKINLLA